MAYGKMTVLDIVQNIASAMTSDDVNSITDTVEAYQIALVVKESYYELVAALNIPSNDSLILLDALNDTSRPNYLKIPEEVKQVEWFKYDYQSQSIAGDYVHVNYLLPEEFILRSMSAINAPNDPPYTQVTDFSGATLNILSSKDPSYWTTFDNTYIVTDSYDSSKDTTLQQSKSLCWGQNYTSFLLEDDFVPDLDEALFPLFLAEAKSTCFQNIKQTAAPKEEQRARRQYIRIQNDLWKADQRKPYDRVPDYGRRPQGYNPLRAGRVGTTPGP